MIICGDLERRLGGGKKKRQAQNRNWRIMLKMRMPKPRRITVIVADPVIVLGRCCRELFIQIRVAADRAVDSSVGIVDINRTRGEDVSAGETVKRRRSIVDKMLVIVDTVVMAVKGPPWLTADIVQMTKRTIFAIDGSSAAAPRTRKRSIRFLIAETIVVPLMPKARPPTRYAQSHNSSFKSEQKNTEAPGSKEKN